MPFLTKDNAEEFEEIKESEDKDELWKAYLNKFENGAVKLSDLTRTKMLDCTGQHLNVLLTRLSDGKTVQEHGWKLYFDVIETEEGERKKRVHTILVKKYKTKEGKEVAVIIDTTEVIGQIGNIHFSHGLPLMVMDWKEFEKGGKFADAKVELKQIERIDPLLRLDELAKDSTTLKVNREQGEKCEI